jgi:hypothetical protein
MLTCNSQFHGSWIAVEEMQDKYCVDCRHYKAATIKTNPFEEARAVYGGLPLHECHAITDMVTGKKIVSDATAMRAINSTECGPRGVRWAHKGVSEANRVEFQTLPKEKTACSEPQTR